MHQRTQLVFIFGFAFFAMFFGSGNLVFPIQIGYASGDYWLLGFLGLLITGIILPFLGLLAVNLHSGSYDSFFAEAGSVTKTLLPFFVLSILGSFGVVPRCITVAHGGISYLFPDVSLTLFSALFCILTYFFCLRDDRMINLIGKWMSPILLIALAVLILSGVFNSTSPTRLPEAGAINAFSEGFVTGYQTMDLFAAFFFASLMFTQFQKALPKGTSAKEVVKFAILPGLLGSGLLSLVYLGFVHLGAHYSELITKVEPQFMLATIAGTLLGSKATLFIAIAMVFSCVTTAVALNNIYAHYLSSLFHLDDRHFSKVLVATTSISFFVSLFSFKGIANFLGPILELTYPSIILLTALGILIPYKLHRAKLGVFYSVLALMMIKTFVLRA